ncbi:GNAT family N-acetyltransferase [Jeongeupia sp. USM3]|uniref:GNAT family N-acetyltransferase n=1 Tax=Jeongeupia sp. USM3 TaxID=1906741 RepID=UPI00089E0673|nr:GNAT family N-acetyltransferase [Jeongeupia sp. USM3]AOY01619.1 hypothetical protein BJP62_14855 [Jeongeupia sp. USM3]
MSVPAPVLRPATPDDADAVAGVYLASRKAFLAYAPLAHPDEAVRAWLRHVLLPAGGTTVAEVDGEICGFVSVSTADGVFWIDQLYVRPASVGRAIGSALLNRILDGASGPVRLHTFQANHGARRFYERFGFVAIAESDGSGNEEGCPDVLYERNR